MYTTGPKYNFSMHSLSGILKKLCIFKSLCTATRCIRFQSRIHDKRLVNDEVRSPYLGSVGGTKNRSRETEPGSTRLGRRFPHIPRSANVHPPAGDVTLGKPQRRMGDAKDLGHRRRVIDGSCDHGARVRTNDGESSDRAKDRQGLQRVSHHPAGTQCRRPKI